VSMTWRAMSARPYDAVETKYEWCANEDGICPCQTTLRYGSTGTSDLYESGYFAQHPEVGTHG
jgi:hypothetical protein